MTKKSKCGLCGEPMPPGERMFKYHGYSGPCPKPPLLRGVPEIDRLRKIEQRYSWLINKVMVRGGATLALYEEFGGAPFQGETIRQFMDRFIDARLAENV